MPSKKKPNPADQVASPPDPREALAPTAANLRATLVELEKVLADVPLPPPAPPPAPVRAQPPVAAPVAVKAPVSDDSPVSDDDDDESVASVATSVPAAQLAAAHQGGGPQAGGPKVPEPIWPPQLDLVEAMLHIYFADGLPCGYGQEARRRIQDNFVDRNEFRVTEAFEVEDMLRDLQIPNLFDRCLAVRDSVAQIYNDQNGVSLAFLRDAGISDRNTFFQRVPALQPHAVAFLTNMLTLEELCFSDKSTLRAQQRLGLDPKDAAVNDFLNALRAMLKPYGQLPLSVGPHLASHKPSLQHTLSPACVLIRLAPAGKKRS